MEKILILSVLLLLIWIGILTYYLHRTIKHYNRLTQGIDKDKLTDILDNIISRLKENNCSINSIDNQIIIMKKDMIGYVQKIGILRYNPFADTGSDQSFILSILDGNDNGIVLTSLHSRGTARWYAKNVSNGQGIDHQLSEEEKKAIKEAEFFNKKKN